MPLSLYHGSSCNFNTMAAIGLLTLAQLLSTTQGVRLCVPGQDNLACAMVKENNPELNITCVQARDRYDCLQRVMNAEADVARGDAADVYLAKELFGADLNVVASTRTEDMMNEPYRYRGVAVVRRSSIKGVKDLRGSKSCHTGYDRTVGWHVPISKLIENGEMTPICFPGTSVVEDDLWTVSSYFGKACIPGKWAPDDETNAKLKTKYSSLCSLCDNPDDCGEQDLHAGYQGALTCLVDSSGDVAWTKLDKVGEFFKSRPTVNTTDFGLLCPDGQIVDLDSVDACHWAARPWPVWLTRAKEENMAAIVSTLTSVMSAAVPVVTEGVELLPPKNWAKVVLGINKRSIIKTINPPLSPNKYLKQAGYDTTISHLGCKEDPVRLCVDSQIAMQKCTALSQVLKSRRVRPPLACIAPNQTDDCVAAVANADADIVSVDGGDLFRGHRDYGLIPLLSERYGVVDASYFAVAVVRADSGIDSLAKLRGKKSCHTGIGKTAGWKIPVVTLLEAGLLKSGDCDYARQMGNFFSSSCAPGAQLPKYDPKGTNPASLCKLCVGNKASALPSSNKCARDSSEAYYSYTGAFRCLAEGSGDVAFVKHTTVRDNTNGNNQQTWAKNLKASDFRILCKNHGKREVYDYGSCHLARVPSHKVVTGPKTDDVLKEEIRIMMLLASKKLPQGQDAFVMFGDYGGYHDIIFKNSATSLVNLREDAFHKSLTEIYFRALTELDSCQPSV